MAEEKKLMPVHEFLGPRREELRKWQNLLGEVLEVLRQKERDEKVLSTAERIGKKPTEIGQILLPEKDLFRGETGLSEKVYTPSDPMTAGLKLNRKNYHVNGIWATPSLDTAATYASEKGRRGGWKGILWLKLSPRGPAGERDLIGSESRHFEIKRDVEPGEVVAPIFLSVDGKGETRLFKALKEDGKKIEEIKFPLGFIEHGILKNRKGGKPLEEIPLEFKDEHILQLHKDLISEILADEYNKLAERDIQKKLSGQKDLKPEELKIDFGELPGNIHYTLDDDERKEIAANIRGRVLLDHLNKRDAVWRYMREEGNEDKSVEEIAKLFNLRSEYVKDIKDNEWQIITNRGHETFSELRDPALEEDEYYLRKRKRQVQKTFGEVGKKKEGFLDKLRPGKNKDVD